MNPDLQQLQLEVQQLKSDVKAILEILQFNLPTPQQKPISTRANISINQTKQIYANLWTNDLIDDAKARKIQAAYKKEVKGDNTDR